jgi:NitT/TauT family transport system ATP-binding protein
MLSITDLTCSYGRGAAARVVLDKISLQVARGELAVIAGPSGSGKSTLLRCIAGLVRPTSGTITVHGAPVHDVPDRLAVVFQDYSRSLYPWLTVRDNVALPLRRTVAGRAQRREIAGQALESVGLGSAGGQYPWQLSGGMQQRTAIARAVACDPLLLLMDEPFGSVDPQAREDLQDLVLDLRARRDLTIVLVTHDIDEAVYTGDRVIVLSAAPGRIRADLPVKLPEPRDQAITRQLPEFTRLRAETGLLIRSPPAK